MAYPLRSLFTDGSYFRKSYQHYLESTDVYQGMGDFIDNLLPDIVASTVSGKSHLNVIGLGSGTGEVDLKMLSALHLRYPEVTVDNEVVEPVPEQINQYRELVSQTPGLDYIKCNWNNVTVQEFEKQWKEKKRTKKADLIHMFEMLYYVEDVGATISFYQSLLNKNGKILISQLTGDCGWAKLDKTYGKELCGSNTCVFSDDIKSFLDALRLSYQSYMVQYQFDITDCFTEGNEGGEMMLDVLTDVLHFHKSASPELKAGVMELLRCPDCSVESNGKVMLNSNYEVIVVDQLP